MHGDLQNLHILISRQAGHATTLLQQIVKRGGNATCVPLFAIESLLTATYIEKITMLLPQQALVVCISKNAAELLLPHVGPHIQAMPQQLWAAIGPSTAACLQQAGLSKLIFPRQIPYDSAALLTALETANINLTKQCIMLLTGKDGNHALAEGLQRRFLGALITTTPIYRRVVPKHTANLLNAVLQAQPRVNIIVITCASSVANLMTLEWQTVVNIYEIPLLVVSQRIYDFAVKAGFKYVCNSNGMSEDAIISALLAWQR